MRTTSLVISFSLLTLSLAGFISGALAFQRCALCGMDVDKSETAFYARMENRRTNLVCSMHCLHMLKMNAKEKAVSIRTEAYPTSRLIDAKSAYFLYKSRLIPKGSMMPHILAFDSEDKAKEYQKKYGGQVVGFEAAMEVVKESMTKSK